MKRNSFLAILVLVLLLTVALFAACNDKVISIHAPRGGSDCKNEQK